MAKSYVSKCDLIVYDLHAGNPKDVKLAIDALAKPNKEDEPGNECILILISSLLAWDRTPKNLEEIKNPNEPDSEEEGQVAEVKEEGEKAEGEEGEAEMEGSVEEVPPAEPSEEHASEKEGEDGEEEKEGEEGEEEQEEEV